MGIDNKKKRQGASGVPTPAVDVPYPDGTVHEFDKAILSGEYVASLSGSGSSSKFIFFGDTDCYILKKKG